MYVANGTCYTSELTVGGPGWNGTESTQKYRVIKTSFMYLMITAQKTRKNILNSSNHLL
jgi:hypothetical protein